MQQKHRHLQRNSSDLELGHCVKFTCLNRGDQMRSMDSSDTLITAFLRKITHRCAPSAKYKNKFTNTLVDFRK